MLAGLRDPAMVVRVALAMPCWPPCCCTAALLTAAGALLSLIHLVALQLVAGVGLDYALFFARRQLDAEERARTLRTLVTCNAMTLLTFGLLAGYARRRCCRRHRHRRLPLGAVAGDVSSPSCSPGIAPP